MKWIAPAALRKALRVAADGSVGGHFYEFDLALARMAAHRPDVMKVDVRTLGQAARQVSALLRAAEHAAIQLVFSRIDNTDTADVLAGLGASYAQGYFFDVPSARLAESAVTA